MSCKQRMSTGQHKTEQRYEPESPTASVKFDNRYFGYNCKETKIFSQTYSQFEKMFYLQIAQRKS